MVAAGVPAGHLRVGRDAHPHCMAPVARGTEMAHIPFSRPMRFIRGSRDHHILSDSKRMEECDSTSAHYNGDLSPDTLLIIGVKGASYRAARAPLFHYLGP